MNDLERTVRIAIGAHSGSSLDDSDEVEAFVSDLVQVLESKRQRTLNDNQRGTLTTLLLAEIDVLETTAKESRDSNMYNWEKAILADRDQLIELANAIGGGSF